MRGRLQWTDSPGISGILYPEEFLAFSRSFVESEVGLSPDRYSELHAPYTKAALSKNRGLITSVHIFRLKERYEATNDPDAKSDLADLALSLWASFSTNFMGWAWDEKYPALPKDGSNDDKRDRVSTHWRKGHLPFHVYRDLKPVRDALLRMEWGQIDEIISPKASRARGNSKVTAVHWTIAVSFVYLAMGAGVSQTKARSGVASVYNASPSTIRSWEEKACPQLLGKDFCDQKWREARRAGEIMLAAKRSGRPFGEYLIAIYGTRDGVDFGRDGAAILTKATLTHPTYEDALKKFADYYREGLRRPKSVQSFSEIAAHPRTRNPIKPRGAKRR
jgi:hypothetical protein